MTERMAALLQYANYQHVGDALGVGRAAVQKWAKGKNVGARQVEQVERLYLSALGLPDAKKEAAPDIPERLERIERLVRAIAVATPGVKLPMVEETIARVDALEQSPQRRGASRPMDATRTRDE